MKKCVSLLLTMAMLLSMVPAAFATDISDIPDPEIEIMEPASKEDINTEIQFEQLSQASKLTDEEIKAQEERRRAHLEARFAASEAASEAEEGVFSLPEVDALNASAGDYTVNIKLNFSSAATRDTEIDYNLYNNDSYFGAWHGGSATLKQGSKTLSFSVPVTKGSYILELYSNNVGWMYADHYGTLSSDWESHIYIGAFGSTKTINVTVDADALLVEDEGGDEPVGTEVRVTVKLPASVTTNARYRTFLRSGNSTYNATENLSAGKNSFTETFNTTFTTFVVGYYDATNIDSYYNVRYTAGARYIAEDGGITSQFSEAKVFTASETSAVTINDTNNYALTGTLNLYGKQEYDKGMYAVAEFENGEQFAGRAFFPAGSTSAKYTIYVPKSLSGSSFTHWAAECEDWNSNRILEGSYLAGEKYTLSANATLKAISLPAPPVTVKGTFSLPAGMKAPSGGLNVAIRAGDQTNTYTLAAGQSSFSFSMTPVLNENQEEYIYAYIENAPDNLCDEFYVRGQGNGLLNLDMRAYETVVVSGFITVPDACKALGSTIRLYTHSTVGEDEHFNNDLYITVLPGQTSAAYELKALKGYEETYVSADVDNDATGKLLSAEMYLQEDGSVGEGNFWFALNKNYSNVNFAYALGKSISGKVVLSKGLPAGYYYGEVTVRPSNGGDNYRNNFHFDGSEGTYSVAVPQEYTGTYQVYYSLYSDDVENALTDCQVWYSTNGMVFERSQATKLSVPEEGLSNIDLVLLTARTVSGSVLLSDGLPAAGFYYGDVYVHETGGDGTSYSGYFNSNNGLSYTVKLPVSDTPQTYLISVYCYNNDSIPEQVVTNTHFYVAEDGSMTADRSKAKQFTIGNSGLVQDVTIPKGETLTVTLNAPAGFSGSYSGRIAMYDLESYSYGNQINFEFENSGTVTFTVAGGSGGSQTLRIRMDEGPGSLTNSYYYYNGETGAWVRNSDDAAPIDTSTGAVSVTVPTAKVLTINVTPPAGGHGAYRGSVQLSGNSYYSQEFEFTSVNGSGTSVTFSLPNNADDTYQLRISLYEGFGVMTGNTYYYTADGSWSSSYSSGVEMPLDQMPASVTMPAAKVITGSLVAADGSAINLGTPNSDNSKLGYISMSAVTGSYLSNTYVVNADGTFSITIPDGSTGTHNLYFSPNEHPGCNVVENSYYYAENASAPVTDYRGATAIDVSGTVPHLTIVVETGYVLSGTVKLAEDASITATGGDGASMGSLQLYLRENVDSNGINEYLAIPITKGSDSWKYSIALPKKNTTYKLEVDKFSSYDTTIHNIYDGKWTVNNSVSVSGDAVLPDVVLAKAKANISVTIQSDKLANSGNDVYTYLYLVAGENTYSASKWLYSGDSISVAIPNSETSASYKLYYQLSSADGLDRGPIYVGANGVLTKNKDEAADLSWTTTSYTLNLLEIPPYLSGKIYLPGYTDQSFEIYLYAYNSKYIEVSPDKVKTDEDGRKYVEYALENSNIYAGYTYKLYAYVSSYDSSVEAEDRLWINKNCYVNPDGTSTTNWSAAQYFTVPDTISATLDFNLADWESASGDCILQSAHNIAPSSDPVTYTYTYVYPGITSRTRMKIVFNSLSDVGVTINGEYDSYISGSNSYVYTDDGVITIEMTVSSEEYYNSSYYGFGVTAIYPSAYSQAYVGSIYDNNGSIFSLSGSSDAAVMSDLNAGKNIYVSQAVPVGTKATAYAAIYDSTGKFLDAEVVPMDFIDGVDCAGVKFDSGYADAATLKVMLLSDTGFAPLMLNRTISR